MATHPPERRYRSDRRRPERAADLHRRIEEKRQQIERRRMIRRQADREPPNELDRPDAVDDRPAPLRPAAQPSTSEPLSNVSRRRSD